MHQPERHSNNRTAPPCRHGSPAEPRSPTVDRAGRSKEGGPMPPTDMLPRTVRRSPRIFRVPLSAQRSRSAGSRVDGPDRCRPTDTVSRTLEPGSGSLRKAPKDRTPAVNARASRSERRRIDNNDRNRPIDDRRALTAGGGAWPCSSTATTGTDRSPTDLYDRLAINGGEGGAWSCGSRATTGPDRPATGPRLTTEGGAWSCGSRATTGPDRPRTGNRAHRSSTKVAFALSSGDGPWWPPYHPPVWINGAGRDVE